jgi:hypothetical protein
MRKLALMATLAACFVLPVTAFAHHSHQHKHSHAAQTAPATPAEPLHGRYWRGQWYEEGIGLMLGRGAARLYVGM